MTFHNHTLALYSSAHQQRLSYLGLSILQQFIFCSFGLHGQYRWLIERLSYQQNIKRDFLRCSEAAYAFSLAPYERASCGNSHVCARAGTGKSALLGHTMVLSGTYHGLESKRKLKLKVQAFEPIARL